jgi:hypothetical protein
MNQNEKVADMVCLMRDGYGLDIDSFREFFDRVVNIQHKGGASTILDCAKTFSEVTMKLANVIYTIRKLADEEDLLHMFDGIKTSDILRIEFKYMEADDLASFHFTLHQVHTEDIIVDTIVSCVLNAFLGEFKIKKI